MKTWYFIIYCVVLAGVVYGFNSLKAEENASSPAFDHFKKAQELYASEKYTDAISELNKAIKLDKNYAAAYNMLAVVHLAKGSTYDVISAERYANQAILIDPNNADYKVTLAKVYVLEEKEGSAQKYLENVTSKNPNEREALYMLGKSHEQKAVFYNGLVNAQDIALYDENYLREIQEYGRGELSAFRAFRSRESDQPILYFDKFFRQEYNRAEDAFKKLDALEPHYKDSDSLRAVLDYQAMDWVSMIKHSQDFVQTHPDSKYGYLILGLAYVRSGNYEKAQETLATFKERLSDEERPYFVNFDFFLSRAQQDSIRSMTPEQREQYHNRFWASRDPLLLADYNTRELEHYARMAESYLLFSVPQRHLEGWNSDRGITWIRYGPPTLRMRNLKHRTYGDELGLPLNETSDEWWYYKDFTLEFYEFPYKSNNFVFYDTRELSFSDIARQIQMKHPDIYVPNTPNYSITFPYYQAQFRGSGNDTQVEFFYGVPVSALTFTKTDAGYVTHARHGVFVINEKGKEVLKNVDELSYTSPTAVDSTDKEVINVQRKLLLNPGNYNMDIEIKDNSANRVGVLHGKLAVESFSSDKLELSDLLQATSIQPVSTGKYFTIADLEYKPNITRTYQKPQNVFLYFEIYNLQKSAGDNKTKYRIDYSVDYKKSQAENKWLVRRIIGKLFSYSENKFELTSSTEYTGSSPNENMYIEIDPSALETGLYHLKLTVEDEVAKRDVSKETVFKLEASRGGAMTHGSSVNVEQVATTNK